MARYAKKVLGKGWVVVLGVVSLAGVCALCSCSEADKGPAARDGAMPNGLDSSLATVSLYVPDEVRLEAARDLCEGAVTVAFRGGYDNVVPGLSERMADGNVVLGSPVPRYAKPAVGAGLERAAADTYPVFCDGRLVGMVACFLDESGDYYSSSAFTTSYNDALADYLLSNGSYAFVEVGGANPAELLASPEGYVAVSAHSPEGGAAVPVDGSDAFDALLSDNAELLEFSGGSTMTVALNASRS